MIINNHRNKPQIKDEWFEFIILNKTYCCNGFTVKRLNDVKGIVLSDSHILYDLFVRHGAAGLSPDEHKAESIDMFNHGVSNFCAAILDKMIDHGIYKIK